MKITKFTFSKLRWIFLNPVFREKPLSVIWRILLWEWIRLSNRPLPYSFDGGHKIMLRPNEGASRLTYYFGNSEPDTFSFMDGYLRPGMCVVDVGANIGLNSIYAARRVGEEGRVIAIEPDPANCLRVRENLGENMLPQIELIEAACGSSSGGSVVVHSNAEDSSRSYVSEALQDSGGREVPVVAIDDLVADREITEIHYLKIDVEGFEEQVLLGALSVLKRHQVHVLHVELDHALLERENSSISDIVAQIGAFGLRLCHWDSGAHVFRPVPGGVAEYYSFFVIPSLIQAKAA